MIIFQHGLIFSLRLSLLSMTVIKVWNNTHTCCALLYKTCSNDCVHIIIDVSLLYIDFYECLRRKWRLFHNANVLWQATIPRFSHHSRLREKLMTEDVRKFVCSGTPTNLSKVVETLNKHSVYAESNTLAMVNSGTLVIDEGTGFTGVFRHYFNNVLTSGTIAIKSLLAKEVSAKA